MSTIQNTLGKMSNYRWTICAMLFFATTVNYLDRQVLSLTWDEFIKPEFHWDESHYGTITSVFSIVYAICMLFEGASYINTQKPIQIKPRPPITINAISQPHTLAKIGIVSGAINAPMDAPALKIEVA